MRRLCLICGSTTTNALPKTPNPPTERTIPMTAKIEGHELVIRIPLNNPPRSSASGKSLVVASSNGNKPTEAKVNGQTVVVGVNAYINRAN